MVSEHGSTIGLDMQCVDQDFIDFLCVSHTYGVCVCCIRVVLAMVAVVSPWNC